MKRLFFAYFSIFCFVYSLEAQNKIGSNFIKSDDILGTRVFIENKGQYNNPINENEKVLFVYDHCDEKIFFTEHGLIYEMRDKNSLTEEEQEAIEHGQPSDVKLPQPKYTRMTWVNANSNKTIQASDKQSHYFTFGEASLNSSTYKKITYLNVYPNIDVEYIIPADKKAGIKYNLIVHKGANYQNFKIAYTGDVKKIKLSNSGEILVKTSVENIIEHAPQSFDQQNNKVPTEYVLENNIISFKLPDNFNNNQSVTIDPWVTAISSLSNNNYGYDVDYDFSGNVYVYGGNGSGSGNGKYKIARYNNTGTLVWTFGGIVTSNGWHTGSSWSCNFKVNRGTNKTYVGRNNQTPFLIRLDANGNYDNFISNNSTTSPILGEVWNMEFNCGGDVQIFGGAAYSGAIVNSSTGIQSAGTTFSPNITGCCQDVVAVAVDAVGNTFVTYLGHTSLQNRIALVAPSYTNSIWLAPTGFSSLTYLQTKSGYVGANTSNAVAYNALAVNMNYVFYYDGNHIGVYNKTTGATVATTVNALSAGQQGGIAVDDCNNIYVGGNGSILCYNFNGTNFSTLTPIPLNTPTNSIYNYVYDIQLNKITNQLYVCGSGFVSNYTAAHSSTCALANVQNPCNFGQFFLSSASNSINCANLLGSATVTPIGGIGPFTYTWLPSGTTGSTATGLGPGTYTVISYDSGANFTFTSNIAFTSTVPLTGNVISTGILNCHGLTNGTAAVTNISGGSGNQTYLWTIGTSTTTNATVNNLGAGNYSVTVTDALTNCSFSQSFAILQPQALSIMIFVNNPTVCAGQSITLTGMGSGGSQGYTYTWTAGPSTDTYVVSNTLAGTYNYSISMLDSHNCPAMGVTSVTFVPNPVLSVSDVSICPLQTGTLSITGASTYTWNNSSTGSTFTDNPLSNQQYTIVGSALGCTSQVNANIILKPVPVPTLVSNSPVCNGQNLNFSALGGISSVWIGPQSYSSLIQSNTITSASPVHSGVYNLTLTALNSCTASASINLTVHPSPTVSAFSNPACTNQTLILNSSSVPGASYFWSGPNGFTSTQQNPSISNPVSSVSGNYTVRASSAQGCTNSAVAFVTVTPMPLTFPSSNSPLCFNDNLLLNGSNTSGAFNYSWLGPNGFNSLLQNTGINNVSTSASGIYTLSVYAGPCVKSNTTMVIVNPLPSVIANNNGPVCEDAPLILNMSNPNNNILVSYVWQGPANYNAYVPLAQINSSKLFHTGIYTLQVTDQNACKNISTTTVTILNNPTVSAVGDTVCLYEPAQLNSFGATSFLWYHQGGNFSNVPNAIVTKAMSLSPTVYTVIGTAANGCTAAATATLLTWALPQPSIQVMPTNEACLNSNFVLNAQGAKYYYWTGPDNKQYKGYKIELYANSLAYSGVYTLTGVDSNFCKTDVTTTLTVHNLPQGSLVNGIKEACVPFRTEYIFNTTFGTSSLTAFSWELDGMVYLNTNFEKTFTKPGNYPLKAKMTDMYGCSNTMSVMINAWPQPKADFSFSPLNPTENLDEVEFINTSTSINITEWNWFFAPDINHRNGFTDNKENTSYLFKEAGKYPIAFVIKNNKGCLDSVVKVVNVKEDFNVFVPTAFTPNGDKHNDLFCPVTRGIKNYRFYVFDRWNELLFECTENEGGWNGTHKGKECKQDVYIWKLIVTSKDDVQKIYSGEVTLIK